MWVGGGASIAYTLLGGLLGVSWRDRLEGCLMIFGVILRGVMVYVGVGGGEEMSAGIERVGAGRGKE